MLCKNCGIAKECPYAEQLRRIESMCAKQEELLEDSKKGGSNENS